MTYLRVYLVLCGDRDLLRFSLLPSEPCWLWRLNEGEWEWLPCTAFCFWFLEASVEFDVGLTYLPASLKRTTMRKVNRWVGKTARCWLIIIIDITDIHLRTLFITEQVKNEWHMNQKMTHLRHHLRYILSRWSLLKLNARQMILTWPQAWPDHSNLGICGMNNSKMPVKTSEVTSCCGFGGLSRQFLAL